MVSCQRLIGAPSSPPACSSSTTPPLEIITSHLLYCHFFFFSLFLSLFFLIRHPSNFCYQVFSSAFYHLRYEIASSDKSGDKKNNNPGFKSSQTVCVGWGLNWLRPPPPLAPAALGGFETRRATRLLPVCLTCAVCPGVLTPRRRGLA